MMTYAMSYGPIDLPEAKILGAMSWCPPTADSASADLWLRFWRRFSQRSSMGGTGSFTTTSWGTC